MITENATTKVYYYLDDSTPYMSIIPVSCDSITLGDFKKVFNRRGYNYFCKEYDADLKREVKVEITSDLQKLHKSANGLIELFLLLQNSSVPPNSNSNSNLLPKIKDKPSSSKIVNYSVSGYKLNKGFSGNALSSIADEMDVGGGQRVSMVTNERSMSGEASSDINTLISKRAGEHLAELYTSTSEDPYKLDGTFTLSNNYRQLLIPNYTREEDEGDKSTIHNYYNAPIQQLTRQRKPRKQRYRKAYVPSTISSASESSLSFSLPRVDEVQLRLQDAPKLGISVACHDGGVFISKIQPGSAADKCKKLEVGDQIVQIENVSFENLSDEQAVNELRKASFMKRTITMYVAKRPRISDQRSDALSLLCETMQLDVSQWVEQTIKQEEIEPISPFNDLNIHSLSNENLQQDLTSNIKHINNGTSNEFDTNNENSNTNFLNKNTKFLNSYNNINNDTSMAAHTSRGIELDTGVLTSDEERAAYADRRNGIGPRLVPALQNKKRNYAVKTATTTLPQHQQHVQKDKNIAQSFSCNGLVTNLTSDGSTINLRSLDHLKNEALNVNMDPIIILKRMAMPDSGLVIKDRKWLKIPVLNSFIGDEMIDWLLKNVNGFKDRKAAKAYASILLANGYIHHVVNITNFNEKCYYIFQDLIINERLRLFQQQQNQMINHSTLASSAATASSSTKVGGVENTTEVTYISSPSSPFLTTNVNSNSNLNNCAQIVLNQNNASSNQPLNNNLMIKIANNSRYVSPPSQLLNNDMVLRINTKSNEKNSNALTSGAIETPPLATRNPNTTWPISPIPIYHNNNDHNLRDCNSPAVTNDYASMIQGEINGGIAYFDQHETNTMRLKENNPPKLLSFSSITNNNLSNSNNGFNNSNSLLPLSIPPPVPLQIPSKNLY